MSNSTIVDDLRAAGIPVLADAAVQPLTGGVSCDVWRVDTEKGPIVAKRPLARLRVAASWHAPVERGTSEIRWLRRAQSVDPEMVPEVLAELPNHGFAMRFIPDSPVWKDELVAGHVDPDFAALVGRRLVRLHSATADNEADRAAFANEAMFRALRTDPFLLHVARSDPEVAGELRSQASELASRKRALVHGDVSPKNILATANGPLFLDAECATYGDPAFDLAFCTTHLLLKTVWLDNPAIRTAAAQLVATYREGIDWEELPTFDRRAGRYTAALLLARIEGKSPAPYLTDPVHRQSVRDQARARLKSPVPITELIDNWQRTPA